MAYIQRRTGGIYYFRRRIPNDLLHHYPGKEAITQSLRVTDRTEAAALALKVAVDLDAEWARLRAMPKPMTNREWRALERDQLEAEEAYALYEEAEQAADAAAERKADKLERAIRIVERRRAEAGKPPLNADVRAAIAPHLAVEPVAPAAVAGPAAVAPAPGEPAHPLSSLIPFWNRERAPTSKTLHSASRAVEEIGDPDVRTVRRQTIIGYRDKLLDAGKAVKTINTRLSFIRSLLSIAKDRGLVEINYADDTALTEKRRDVDARMPYEPEQIQTVLTATAGMREDSPEMYWLPRLALWTSGRINELHQLRKADIQVREGVPGVMITDAGEYAPGVPMKLKNAGSKRWVPLAGPVREFAEWASAAPDGALFPAKANKFGVVSDAFSKRYGRFLREEVRIADKRVTFHSWRHTFADRCRDAAVDPEVRMALMGHAEGGSAGAYGAGRGLHPKRLIEAMDKLAAAYEE